MRAKKKVGKTLPLEDSPRGKGRAVGSRTGSGDIGSPGERHGPTNDAGDVGGKRIEQGVLRQPEQLEQVSVQPGDPIKQRGTRPGFIRPTAPKELISSPWTILRYRTARAEANVTHRNILNAEVLIPLKKARELLTAKEESVKWTKLCLQSVEDFEAILSNPDWLVEDRIKRIEQIVGTMHSRLTNFKRTLE